MLICNIWDHALFIFFWDVLYLKQSGSYLHFNYWVIELMYLNMPELKQYLFLCKRTYFCLNATEVFLMLIEVSLQYKQAYRSSNSSLHYIPKYWISNKLVSSKITIYREMLKTFKWYTVLQHSYRYCVQSEKSKMHSFGEKRKALQLHFLTKTKPKQLRSSTCKNQSSEQLFHTYLF